ncbi:MAG: hypothetical protein ACR2QC_06425 [Gammaproteobacteria bacterium]
MKKINLIVCRAFRAVFDALNNVFAPTLNFKGGGGAKYKNAPFGGVFQRLIFAFGAGILFAAVGTTAAYAQQADAQADVYQRASETFTDLVGIDFDLSETVAQIVAGIVADANAGQFASVIRRFNPGDPEAGLSANPTVMDANGLPLFGSGESIEAGDLLGVGRLTDGVRGPFVVYGTAPDNWALAEATGETKTAAELDTAAGELFLDGNFAEATDITPQTQGYVAATGGGNGGENTGGDGTQTSGSDGDSNARDLAVIGLGVGVVGFMAAYLSGGDFSLFHFAPDYGYSATESGYAYNVGGRLNFRKDRWHLYYAAGQANSNGDFGDFRYESGGEYTADLWTAAFSETVQGETADYDFSLSADYHGGIWKVSPTYRLHSHLTETYSETDNALNLEGVLRYNRWTISPSAGFRWESADEFGDNARFNLSAVRRF